MLKCKKCDESGTIILRRKDAYCKDCFISNVNHKFRACIGKNKILSRNENVLVCVSGGEGSTVLFDLIHRGVSLNQHKKLRITPILFHIMGLQGYDDDIAIAESLIKHCSNYNFNVYLSHISEYNQSAINININTIPKTDPIVIAQFQKNLRSMSVTSKNDLLGKMKREMYLRYARELECNHIFTGETTATLAVNLLSNLTLGRGSQVEYDVGFCDSRSEIKILRPMKDVSHEELQHYINVMELDPLLVEDVRENCLQSVIKSFVTDLQDNFQATVSTVCKTADKLGVQNDCNSCTKCKVCESVIGQKNSKLSALEATNYSRTVSIGQTGHKAQTCEENTTAKSKEENNISMFPHINKYLCYTCSKNYIEMDLNNLPNHLIELLHSQPKK